MRRMLIALLVAAGAAADTEEQAADGVVAAWRAKDKEALKALAAKDDPDPWLVAYELCFRGEHDAAEAFAKAAPREAIEKLPEYVAGQRGRQPDRETHEARKRMEDALSRGDMDGALEAAKGIEASTASIASIRVACGRGIALAGLRRREDSDRTLREAAAAARELGWLSRADDAYHEIGINAYNCRDWGGALAAWRSSLETKEAMGDEAGIASTLFNVGLAAQHMGRNADALSAFERSLAIFEASANETAVAQTLIEIGTSHLNGGEYPEALASYRRALDKCTALGDQRRSAGTLNNIGAIHERLGEYGDALSAYQRSLEISEAIDDPVGISYTLGNIANVHARKGEYLEALPYYRRSLDIATTLDHKPLLARTLNNLGTAQIGLCDFPEALATYQRCLEASKALGYGLGVANAHLNIGNIHQDLGDHDEALAAQRRALEIAEAMGDKPLIARAMNNIGLTQYHRGDHAGALSSYQRSLEIKEALRDRQGIASTLLNIGLLHLEMGEYAEALSAYNRALAGARDLDNSAGVASSLSSIGTAHYLQDDYPQALLALRQALDVLDAAPNPDTRARVLWRLGLISLAQERWGPALRQARETVEIVQRLGRGLGEQQGAIAVDLWSEVFEVGMRAAVGAKDSDELLFFLESGRATCLRESIGARDALRSALLPEALRGDELAAREREARATEALRAAAARGKLEGIRKAEAELAQSERSLEEVIARIQRTAKSGASIAYPEVDGVGDMQPRLADREALLLYGLTKREGVVLVVRRTSVRIVTLAPSEELLSAAAAFDAGNPARSPETASLRSLLVEPLELEEDVNRVLVSPEGRLGYLPFALLFPKREVAYLPSGTTYGLLLEESAKRGEAILAVGDPDYGTAPGTATVSILRRGAERLVPLPATRDEVEVIGSVKLLGGDATEEGVVAAIGKRERWRAVHFACHGLVDPEHPMLSSLALTPTKASDGFLKCLDVFRMSIPADLVVLSACETGKGRIYRAEGIFGLTRAFMYAGSPRVICSLWKVDDEATRALMVKFYELWNPKDGSKGLPAATALKKAMEHVRDHPDHDWKHPYYWAAWQLWGLPE